LAVPSERDLLIAAEQVRAQYGNMPTAFISNAVVAVILCFVLREVVALPTLTWWLGGVYLWVIGRYTLWRRFNRVKPPAADIGRWRTYALIGSALSGILWGLGGMVLYVPGNLWSQFLLLIVQFGMGSGAAYASASTLPSFLAYFFPSLLLSAIPFFREGDTVHVSLGIMLLLFTAATTRFSFGVSRTVVDAIKLRFENIELINELREQKAAADDACQASDQANIAKSRFLAVASHDLREPLHALDCFVDEMRGHVSTPQGVLVIGKIRRSVDTMGDIFNSLLDVSRLDAGIVRPEIVTLPLAPLLERIRFEFEPLALRKGLTFTVRSTDTLVRSDSALLERMIRNLAANSVRCTDGGGVVIGCRKRDEVVRIEVWDTGHGTSRHKRQEISQGFGLGLAIVERLARLLDHPVELRSTVGKGSLFCITVPLGRSEDQAG
jgi:two-component system, sensor histidine kinase